MSPPPATGIILRLLAFGQIFPNESIQQMNDGERDTQNDRISR
jgi:hypothetical protein